MAFDLVVLYEHPEWQKPLFAALDRRGVHYAPFDLKRAAFDPDAVPEAPLYFNQASPSAYVRGNTRAVPFALSLMRSLELGGARVLNGSRAFSLELSKSAQAALLKGLNIAHPKSLAFNDPEVALQQWSGGWPALVKPEQGGSGARMFLLNEPSELHTLLRDQPDLWLPDNLLLLQEYFPAADPLRGIVRMEFLGGKFLYAMRVVSHGAFNLCPSVACNPEDGSAGHCEIPAAKPSKPVEFYHTWRSPRRPWPPANGSWQPVDWTSAVSSSWKRRTGVWFSTTSTRTRTSARRLAKPGVSTLSSGWWTTSCRKFPSEDALGEFAGRSSTLVPGSKRLS